MQYLALSVTHDLGYVVDAELTAIAFAVGFTKHSQLLNKAVNVTIDMKNILASREHTGSYQSAKN